MKRRQDAVNAYQNNRYVTDSVFREATKDRQRKVYRSDPAWGSLKGSLRKFKLTLDEYHSMQESQDFRCFLCVRDVPLCIDHNHFTQIVRKLICGDCNRGLGGFSDNPQLLRNAADYCETYGISTTRVTPVRAGRSVGLYDEERRVGLVGELHHNAKLDRFKVSEIKRRLIGGEIASVIAADYGVMEQSIRSIGSGKSWGHVI